MPHTTKPILSSTLRWLYVDFNSYFASVEQQLDVRLRGKPVIVVPVETDSTSAIAASYEAKAFGIKTGTPVWEAKKMCSGIICVLAKHEAYVDYHQRILQEIDKHIPITMVCSIDEVACRLMDNEISVETATEIADRIKAGLAKNVGEYIKCSIGVAPNRYLAKIATDFKKPDGFTFIHPEELPGKLLELKLRDLPGIGRNMEQRLKVVGITNMQDIWKLDAAEMRKAWGNVWGEKTWFYLRGYEVQEEETTRSTIGHSHVMAPELRDPAKAKFVARRLTLKVASRLRRIGYFASSFHISARLDSGARFEEVLQCYRAQDSITFLNMLNESWARLTSRVGKNHIKKVSISLHGLTASNDIQPDLFSALPDKDSEKRSKAEKISKALDTINHKFGRDSALIGMLPSQGKSFSGTKIAFTRIPDVEEFIIR